MAIWQLGWKGNMALGGNDPEWFDGIWGQFYVPKERWFNGAYVWIGCWTEQKKFMQVGIFPQWPNGTISGSTHPGSWGIFYSTDSLGYFLQPFDSVEILPGDEVILSIMKNLDNKYWQIWCSNSPMVPERKKTGGTMYDYDAGEKIHITNLFVVFEGYSDSVSNTEFLKAGGISISPVRVRRADINQQIPIPNVIDFDPAKLDAYAKGNYIEPPIAMQKHRTDEDFQFFYNP